MSMAKKKSDNNEPEKVPSPNQVNPPHEIDSLAKEGQSMLTPADEIPIPVKPVVVDEKNPYQRAKTKLYAKMPQWRRIELDKMFESKNMDNRHYIQFIKDLNTLAEWIIADDLEKEQKKPLTSVKK